MLFRSQLSREKSKQFVFAAAQKDRLCFPAKTQTVFSKEWEVIHSSHSCAILRQISDIEDNVAVCRYRPLAGRENYFQTVYCGTECIHHRDNFFPIGLCHIQNTGILGSSCGNSLSQLVGCSISILGESAYLFCQFLFDARADLQEIGRASCRERV